MIKAKQIEGWMGAKSRRWLRAQSRRSERIIEVGVWKGRSTLVLARATKGKVWAVDTWAGVPGDADQQALYEEAETHGPDAIYAEFRENLRGFIKAGKVIPLRMDSKDAATYLLKAGGRTFDFVFIDADHSYQGARGDILAYLPLLKPGGLLAGHDYHWPGVERAVTELLEDVTLGPRSIWSVEL